MPARLHSASASSSSSLRARSSTPPHPRFAVFSRSLSDASLSDRSESSLCSLGVVCARRVSMRSLRMTTTCNRRHHPQHAPLIREHGQQTLFPHHPCSRRRNKANAC
eukprot:3762979-Rhodomonas_salina.2